MSSPDHLIVTRDDKLEPFISYVESYGENKIPFLISKLEQVFKNHNRIEDLIKSLRFYFPTKFNIDEIEDDLQIDKRCYAFELFSQLLLAGQFKPAKRAFNFYIHHVLAYDMFDIRYMEYAVRRKNVQLYTKLLQFLLHYVKLNKNIECSHFVYTKFIKCTFSVDKEYEQFLFNDLFTPEFMQLYNEALALFKPKFTFTEAYYTNKLMSIMKKT
jgi:hypothetical protein